MASLDDKHAPSEVSTFASTYGGDSEGKASMVRERYWEGVQGLRSEMRDYWLNHSFLHGFQWLFWSESTGRLDELPQDPERVQATVNRIWPNSRTIISTLMQRELVFEVPPSAADDSHVRGARLAETISRAVHNDHSWEELREHLMYAVWKGGTAALCVDWDDEAEEILSDDTPGSPVTKGDTYEEHLNITQFVVEPGTRYPEKARYWIKAVALPPAEVKDMFDLPELPPSDASAGLAPFHRKLMSYDRGGDAELTDLTLVLTYYERPNPSCPEGKVLQVVDSECVFDSEWPFPFKDKLNLVIIRETLRENRWTGDTVLTAARPLQTLLNVSWSSIAEHMKLAGNARLLVPYSSIEMMENLSDLPGEMVPYNDSLPVKPDYLSPPQMPGWWIQQPEAIADQIDDIMGVHDISRGSAPANIESGFGLTILAEKDNTPVGRLTKETARAFGRLMSLVLAIYEAKTMDMKVSRRSTVKIPGNAPLDVTWNGKDLKGQTTAFVPEEAIMPRSRAAALEFAKDMLQTYGPEEINPATFIALAELPNGRDLLSVTSPDVDKARRENSQFGLGRQSIPRPWDDHKAHISEHNKYRKTVDFEMLELEEQEMIESHIQAHATLGAEEIGDGRARSNIDPALAEAPTSTEAPVVAPLQPGPLAGGPPPGPPAAALGPPPPMEGMGDPGVNPDAAASEIMQLMQQMGG
jgi:hypothetical protein